MTEQLRAARDIDGLFVVSETSLGGALSALAKSGRQVPGDVALICADDGPSRLCHDPPITVVTQPTAELGAALGEVLIETIERPAQRRSRVFPPQLVVRESTPARTEPRAAR